MPRRKAQARLYLDPTRRQWVIRDGAKFIRTGCAGDDLANAEGQLAAYLGKKYTAPQTGTPSIIEVLSAYASEIVPHRVSRKNIAYNIGTLSAWWGEKRVGDVTSKNCRAYAATRRPAAAHADLKVLRAAIRHWQREHAPLSVQPMIWMPPASPARERWLTRHEVARLLWAARRTQHIRRLVLLGVYTGSRPGVLLRLQWDQVDLAGGVMTRNRPGAITHARKRAPKVRLGRRILAHLRRWRRVDSTAIAFVCHFDGRQVSDPHSSWRRAVANSGLPGRITPHTLRHTRATWLMQAGISPWEAAGALGMTVKTLEATYAHHHPNWQKDAAEV